MEMIKLNLGDKIKVQLYNSDGEDVSQELASQYERLLPDGSMEILAPIKGGIVFPIHRGIEIGVMFEKDGKLYTFKAETIERKALGNVNLLRIIPKSEVEYLQRRLYYRFECVLDAKNRFFENMDDGDRGEYKDALIKDISGGGLRILTNDEPKNGWYLDGIIDIGSEVHFTGKVVHVNKLRNKGQYRFEAGIEFVEISSPDREKVISFIFASQRKMLKKGWSTT